MNLHIKMCWLTHFCHKNVARRIYALFGKQNLNFTRIFVKKSTRISLVLSENELVWRICDTDNDHRDIMNYYEYRLLWRHVPKVEFCTWPFTCSLCTAKDRQTWAFCRILLLQDLQRKVKQPLSNLLLCWCRGLYLFENLVFL